MIGLQGALDALRLATINGAKATGLAEEVALLIPGKRADMILVRTASLNLGVTPNANPYWLMISAQTEDVDNVIVDGLFVKRAGKMGGLDVNQVLRDAGTSISRLRARANWPEVAC